jgi:acetyl esterase/lipase
VPIGERLQLWLTVMAARRIFKTDRPAQDIRALYERFAAVSRERMLSKFPKLEYGDHDFGGIYAESTCSVRNPSRTLVHLHGGVYFAGSAASFRVRTNNLSYRCRARVFLPEYRLAPEHPFPAAIQDAKAAWLALVEEYPDHPLYLSGDSPGGGLALALMMLLRDEELPLPQGCIVISPWTDLTMSSPSIDANGRRDWIDRRRLESWVPQVLAGASPDDPRISPLFGNFAGLPPLLFVAGAHEAILDESLRCATKARDASVAVREVIGERMIHDYPLALPKLAESQRAWSAITQFLES